METIAKKLTHFRISLLFVALLLITSPISALYDDYDYGDFSYGCENKGKEEAEDIVSEFADELKKYKKSRELWVKDTLKDSAMAGFYGHLGYYGATSAFLKTLENKDLSVADKYKLCREKQKALNANIKTAGINVFGKQYAPGGQHYFKAVGSLKLSREIFFKNYFRFGKKYTFFHDNSGHSVMGFADNEEDPTQKMIFNGVSDLLIFQGKDVREKGQGIDFCYENCLISESPTLGATLAIKDMMLRATTDVVALNKKTSAIKGMIQLLENPATATLIEKELNELQKFEDDFLNLNEEGSVLERNIIDNFFLKGSDLKENNQKSEIAEKIECLIEDDSRFAGIAESISSAFTKVNDTINSHKKKAWRMVSNSSKLLTIMPFLKLMARVTGFINDIKDARETFLPTNTADDKLPFGFNVPELWKYCTNKDFLSLSSSAKNIAYTMLAKDYVEFGKNMTNIFSGNPTDYSRDWVKGFVNPMNLLVLPLITHMNQPVKDITAKQESLSNSVTGLMGSFAPIKACPLHKVNKFKTMLNNLVTNPIGFIKGINKDITKTFPDAFNRSYERLTGVSRFFNATKRLTGHISKTPEISENLKLFTDLTSFCELSVGRKKSSLDLYRSKLIVKIKGKVRSLRLELGKLQDDSLTKEQEANKKKNESMIKKLNAFLPKVIDQLKFDNTQSVLKLLKSLDSKIFKKKAVFLEKNFSNLLSGHIGTVSKTYNAMFELKEHFYPMYQAVSEVLAIAGLAKKVILSKSNQHNKLCIVDFEESKELPHIKVKEGWNPTAILDIKKKFPHIVASSFELGGNVNSRDQHMLLTGPNGFGKSTFMRGAAYQIWTAQTLGIAPAEEMSLTPFHFLYSLNKNVEDAEDGMSTHMKQIQLVNQLEETVAMLAAKKQFAWINCDEMFNGTDTKDASANIILFLKKISSASICCVATHHKDATKAEEKTNHSVCCYKINAKSFKLEKGVMFATESTNIDLMKTHGKATQEDLTFVAQLVNEFSKKALLEKV